MKKLLVYLKDSPLKQMLVGSLVQAENRKIYFEYDSEFLKTEINISPFKLKWTSGIQENSDSYPKQIHGVFDDSLPDGWGMLLMDRFFRKHGNKIHNITPIDRLAYIGQNGMGSLIYKPESNRESNDNLDINLYELSKNSISILKGEPKEVLPIMAKAGGSAGGARPKILVGYNGKELLSGESDLPDSFSHWLIKFRSVEDFKDIGKVEYVYSQMAEKAGLKISKYKLFNDNKNNFYFGTKRFDRQNNNKRIHVHTLANLIHADFRIPSVDYEILFRVSSAITKNYKDLLQCYRLMIFNVLSHNRDDHAKNFSFSMNDIGRWSFSPAYDLVFSFGPGGEHSTTIAGEGKNPTKSDFDKLADISNISIKDRSMIIEEVEESVGCWEQFAKDVDISKKTIKDIQKQLLYSGK